MSRFDVRDRDLARLRDVVAALRAPPATVTPGSELWWGAPVELLSHDPRGPGVPWRSLELMRDLLEVESLVLHVVEPGNRRWSFGQEVGPGGPMDFWYLGMGPGGPPDTPNDVPAEILEWEVGYWDNYGTCAMNSAEIADWDVVLCSQDVPLRERAEWAARVGQPWRHNIAAATRFAPGRHAELDGIRSGWGSYSDRTRGYLELLKPHFMQALLTSCAPEPPVTAAQLRVLEQVGVGHTNRQVARDLGISEATVRTHLQNAYAALGVNNRVAAVAAAFGSADAVVPTQRTGSP